MITQQQALEALEALKHAGPDGWGPIEHFTTLRQYIEQGAQPRADVVPPFGSKRAAALALYCPPFKFRMGYIHDAGGHMVADQDGFGEGSKVFDSIAARVRGWGRIGYLPDAEALQDEVGAVIADALTAYWAAAPQPQQEQP